MNVQRKMLLTPKSVNDTLNTKVQRYWETRIQPGGSRGGEDEKVKIKIGKPKTHLMDNMIDISIKLVFQRHGIGFELGQWNEDTQ